MQHEVLRYANHFREVETKLTSKYELFLETDLDNDRERFLEITLETRLQTDEMDIRLRRLNNPSKLD